MDYVGYAIGLIGVLVSIYFGVKAKRLERRIKRYSWADIESGISFLANHAFSEFSPDVILTVSMPGTIVASLMLAKRAIFLPCLMASPFKVTGNNLPENPSNTIVTSKWHIHVPDELLSYRQRKIMIVDGAALTGDTMIAVNNFLVTNGFSRSNIYWATLFATEMALEAGKAPNIHWITVPDSNVYLPWGRIAGPGS